MSPGNSQSELSKTTTVQKETPLKTTVVQLLQRQRKLEEYMCDILEKLSGIDDKLDRIMKGHGQPDEIDDLEEPIISLLPIKNHPDFQALEKKLLDLPPLSNKLVKVLQSVGGSDTKTLSINIMRRTLTDDLAQAFSFSGKKGYKDEKKEAFSATQLFKCIQLAIRKALKDNFSEETTKKHITMWLNQAKTRITRREERRNAAVEKEGTPI